MEFASHAFSGVVVLAILHEIWPLVFPIHLWTIIFVIGISMFPDIDVLSNSTLNKHHESPLHKPIFWIAVTAGAYILASLTPLVSFMAVHLLLACTLFHLFADYVTARTTGVQVLYPFDKKEHSLYPTKPSLGNFNIFNFKDPKFKVFRKVYFKNIPLVIFEYSIFAAGVIILITWI